MALAENANERLTYKAYTSGVMSSTEADTATDPGSSGGQILRYVSQSLNLTKGISRPNERRTDRQMAMGRHTTRRNAGAINGLVSPGTYGDLMEAVLRGTWNAAVSLTESELTSVTASKSGSSFTFGGGDPVALGLKVGHPIRFTGLTTATDNAKNFVITGFSGSNNRTMVVYPAPDDISVADTAFTVDNFPNLIIPASGHLSRKFAFEVYDSDVDVARLFTESRMTGMSLSFPAEDDVTIGFNVMGRNRVDLTAANAPYFTSPAAQTTTDFLGPIGGLIRIGGTQLGTLTSLAINLDLQGQSPAVRGAGVPPDILLGDAALSGDFTVFLQDATFLDAFTGEEELELLAWATTSEADNSPGQSFYLPRIKINSNDESDSGGAKVIRCQWTAARYVGSGAGIESTSIQICDTEVVAS